MIQILVTWVMLSTALFITAKLVPGFKLKSFGSSFIAVALIGLFNSFLRPILLFLTLPINILTLGLFTFVVNAIILRLAAGLLGGFAIFGWGPAILGAIVLALVQALMAMAFGVPL